MDHEYVRNVQVGPTRLEPESMKPFFPVTLDFCPKAIQDLRCNKEASDAEYAEIGRQLCQAIWNSHCARGVAVPSDGGGREPHGN